MRIDPGLTPAVIRVSGMAIDSQGNIFLSDEYSHRILKLSSSGDVLWAVGEKGKGDGAFCYPRGLAVLEELGRVLVCDSWNHRVVALDFDGKIEFTLGEVGSGAGQFYEPQSICANDVGELIVVDRGNHRLQRFSKDGRFKGMVGRRGSAVEQEIALLCNTPNDLFSSVCFRFPAGIANLSSDGLSVLDAGNRRVLVLTDQLEPVSEYNVCCPGTSDFRPSVFGFRLRVGADGDDGFAPTAIAANDAGFFFLLDNERRLVQQVAPPGVLISEFKIEASAEDGEGQRSIGFQPQLLATAGGLVAVSESSCELSFYELEPSSLKDAVLSVLHLPDRIDAATESLVSIGLKRRDADLINKAVTGVISQEASSFEGLRAAAHGLIGLEQPLNLYLLLSRAVQEANCEREQIEKEQVESLRELDPRTALSAQETVACEAALIADDASPHSAREANALRDYQNSLLSLRLLMAREKRLSWKLIEVVRDAAVLYRRRELWEGFEFCLGVLLQVASREAESLKSSLLSIRNRLGEMIGLSKQVMADCPEQQAATRFVYLGRYRAVLEASRGLHLGVFGKVADSIGAVLGKQTPSSANAAECLERTGNPEEEFARRLLDSTVAAFVVGGADREVLDLTGRFIWTLVKSYPGLRRLAAIKARKDALAALGYDRESSTVTAEQLERFVYSYLFSTAVDGQRLVGASVFEEASSVVWNDVNLSTILDAIRSRTSDYGGREERANSPLDAFKQVRDSIVNHGQSWARVVLESYMRLAGLRASPRAVANKALLDSLTNRQRDCYGTVFEAHRMSLEGSSQLLKLLVAGMILSGDERLILQVGKELSTTRLVEILERLASNVCPPLADNSGKPASDQESLTNLGQRNEVLNVVQDALNGVRLLFADCRFHLSLSGVKFGVQLGDDGAEYVNKGTTDLLIAASESYVRCQRGLREWLWSHWGKESLGLRESVLDPALLGELAASNVLFADRAMRTRHLLKALHWTASQLAGAGLRARPEVKGGNQKRAGTKACSYGLQGHDVLSVEENPNRPEDALKLPKQALKALFYLYCDPSTRNAAKDFWQRVHGGRTRTKSEGCWVGLAEAAGSMGSRTSRATVRTQADLSSDGTEFLDAMVAWMQKTCAYCADLAKQRSAQRDEGGKAFRPVPFADGAKNSVADLHFSSCYEAVLTTVALAVSSGLDAASVLAWDPERARASLEDLVADISLIDVPDNLCDWARGNVARILGVYRTFFDQLTAVNEMALTHSDGDTSGLDMDLVLRVSEPGSPGDDPLTFLPRLILDNYDCAAKIGKSAKTARDIGRQPSSVEGRREEFLAWIDAVSARINEWLQEVEKSRQICWSRLHDAKTRAAQAVASQQWGSCVAALGWEKAVELLSEMVGAASGLRSALSALRGELVLLAWSPKAGPEDRERFFQQVEGLLRKDPARSDVRRKLSEVILRDESHAADVKRAVRLRSTFNVKLIERLAPGLVNPYGVISDELGRLLIADFGNDRIGRLDRTTRQLKTLVVPEVPRLSGSFSGPFGLAQWKHRLWCSFAQGDLLVQYDERLREVRRLGPAIGKLKLGRLFGLALDEVKNQLHVADHDGNCIWTVKEAEKGSDFTVERAVTVDGPLGVAVDAKGRTAVSLQNKNEVHLFGENWKLIGVLDGFSCPHFVAFDADSSLFVADTRNDCVKRFSEGGDLIYSIPVNVPAGVWVDGDELFVTSVDTGELSIYSFSAET
ncbi:MAG: hypothetical protein JW759_08900 [Candidatus Coatesbacteria bacterium]|nr:hypothetical protein [Candidatus Coatesbacteria bacterium]